MFGYKTENGIVPAGNNRFAVLSDSCVLMKKTEGTEGMKAKKEKSKKEKSKKEKSK
jgi:hypothetical protein